MVPTGFRFNPTDEELIQILHQKTSGINPVHLHFITEKNVYESEPQNLEWEYSVVVNSNERYYYCRRKNDSREVTGRGWWKATSHVKTVHVNANGGLVGYKRPLTFHRFGGDGRKRNNPIKTNWIMHEYSLHSTSSTEWRLCRIKYKGKEDNIRNPVSTHQSIGYDAAGNKSIFVQGLIGGSSSPLPPQQDITSLQSSQSNDEPNFFWSSYSIDHYLEPMEQPFGDNDSLNWPWENIDVYNNL